MNRLRLTKRLIVSLLALNLRDLERPETLIAHADGIGLAKPTLPNLASHVAEILRSVGRIRCLCATERRPWIRNIGEAEEVVCSAGARRPRSRQAGPPVTNIRNMSSPHWRGWLKPEDRCFVPANSLAGYDPKPNPETKKNDVVWFALEES